MYMTRVGWARPFSLHLAWYSNSSFSRSCDDADDDAHNDAVRCMYDSVLVGYRYVATYKKMSHHNKEDVFIIKTDRRCVVNILVSVDISVNFSSSSLSWVRQITHKRLFGQLKLTKTGLKSSNYIIQYLLVLLLKGSHGGVWLGTGSRLIQHWLIHTYLNWLVSLSLLDKHCMHQDG